VKILVSVPVNLTKVKYCTSTSSGFSWALIETAAPTEAKAVPVISISYAPVNLAAGIIPSVILAASLNEFAVSAIPVIFASYVPSNLALGTVPPVILSAFVNASADETETL
jgi:hypothetical protein